MSKMGKEYHAEYNLRRYYQKKKKYTDLLGGKCAKCGSKDNLDFDHIDNKKTKFRITSKITYAEDIVLKELKKCQLLCGDCHAAKTADNKEGDETRARGSRVSTSKLTEEQVIEIRKRLLTETRSEVCKDYPIKRRNFDSIASGKTWKHLLTY